MLFINSSQEDLSTLAGAKHIYHIKGGEGAAKDREAAKRLVNADIKNIVNEISNTVSEEYIFVIFSAGGGTGSGSAPALIERLSESMPGKKICGIAILPSCGESLKAKINAYECFAELVRLPKMNGLFVLDNKTRSDKLALNESFVELFAAMAGLPEYTDMRGNIDTRELKQILDVRGCIQISVLPSGQSSTPKLIESIKNSIFAQAEQDGIIQYIALSAASEINAAALYNNVGKPLDLFQGYNGDATICVLSGLSYPYTRLEEIRGQISEEQDIMKKVWSIKKQILSNDGVDLGVLSRNASHSLGTQTNAPIALLPQDSSLPDKSVK